MTHEVLGNGSIVYLVNCAVSETKLVAGFGFFEGNCPDTIPIKDLTSKTIGNFELPIEAKGSAHPVALGDFSSPIEMKRIS